jgi:hypothetical protein
MGRFISHGRYGEAITGYLYLGPITGVLGKCPRIFEILADPPSSATRAAAPGYAMRISASVAEN